MTEEIDIGAATTGGEEGSEAGAGDATVGDAPAPDHSQDDNARRPRRLDLVVGVGITVLVLDQLTKHWAVNRLSGYRVIDVVGSLRFNLAYNTGASFSIGSESGIGPWVGVIALVVVVALALGETSRSAWGALAAGLIAGGAIGNLVDRAFRGDVGGGDAGFMHGAVIDFIDLQWWPVFNIADMGVVGGAILLLFVSLRAP